MPNTSIKKRIKKLEDKKNSVRLNVVPIVSDETWQRSMNTLAELLDVTRPKLEKELKRLNDEYQH